MTDLEAANRALILLAVEPVSSLSENVKAARVVSALLEHVKHTVLLAYPWPFAMEKKALVPVSSGTGVFFYTSDMLSVYDVTDTMGKRAAFSVRGERIYSDIVSGTVEYLTRATSLEAWPAQLLECFVLRLAHDAANALTGSPQLASSFLEKYQLALREAMQTAASEGRAEPFTNTDYFDARG